MEKTEAPKPGYYRHWKGKIYVVLGTVLDTHTEQRMVLYRCFTGDGFFARSIEQFNELVPDPRIPEHDPSQDIRRFEPLTREETLALFR